MHKQTDINIKNKKASFDYAFIETYTAGLVLTGTEIKSIREGKASLVDTYCFFELDELWVKNMHIAHYLFGTFNNDISRLEGIMFLLIFAAYIWYCFKFTPRETESETNEKQLKIWQAICLVLVGLGGLIGGGQLFVNSATAIAKMLGVSDKHFPSGTCNLHCRRRQAQRTTGPRKHPGLQHLQHPPDNRSLRSGDPSELRLNELRGPWSPDAQHHPPLLQLLRGQEGYDRPRRRLLYAPLPSRLYGLALHQPIDDC